MHACTGMSCWKYGVGCPAGAVGPLSCCCLCTIGVLLPPLTQPSLLPLPAQEVTSLHEQLRVLQEAHAAVEQQAAQAAQQLEQQTALATADSQAQQEWLGVVKQVGCSRLGRPAQRE